MKLTKSQINEKYTGVLTTEKVNNIIHKINQAEKLRKEEHIWFDNQVGVRKADLRFASTQKEVNEYAKCKLDVQYFADNNCQIKLEDGSVGRMTLRDYQKDIIDLYMDNNFSILMASRQMGKTISAALTILHFCLFNRNKGIMIVANKGATVIEIIEKIKSIYKLLPFYLKVGIVNWNQTSIVFDNGCRIKTEKRTKEPAIGFTIDMLYLDEFAHIPNNIIGPYFTAVVPTVSSIENAKIIITSTPKGLNLFHKLLVESELEEDDPQWNGFRSLRIYWWQMKGRRDAKIFFTEAKLRKFKITKTQIKDFLEEKGYETYAKKENGNYGLFIKHNKHDEHTNIEFIRTLRFNELPITELGIITNWEEQQTKLIGGEDAFKQEYDLQFLTGNKMLFDSVTLEKIVDEKEKFEYIDIPSFNKKLPYPYSGLKFIKGRPDLFQMADAKKYRMGISIDLSEGLGSDYSIINIFRLLPKTKEEIDAHKRKLTDVYDYFKLEQVGIFKSNIYSVKGVAHILYMITFELFNDDIVRIALERNTYGDELLAHIPHVFNDVNKYSSHVFLKYKQKAEDKIAKRGLKINRNKKILIKDYQTHAKKANIVVHELSTITEISTFTKHETPSGDITFKAESGHDDCIMTCITMSSFFGLRAYKDFVDEYINESESGIDKKLFTEFVDEYVEEKADISSFATARRNLNNSRNQVHDPYSRSSSLRPNSGHDNKFL